MNPDKTAIEKLWEKHSFDYHEPGVRDPVRVMIKDDFLAALSEAEGDGVNWQQLAEGFRLERNIMQEMAMKAREAGRREGHLDALQALVTGLGMDINVRALIDSPKAEGEEPDATR